MNRKTTSIIILSLLMSNAAWGQLNNTRSVFTNTFKDNWEVGIALEATSFYSGNEEGMEISRSPFDSKRVAFGATAFIGKWFTPEIGLRTKASGYWGKAVSNVTPDENSIRFYGFHEQAMINITNIIMGYNASRKWNIIPFAGLAVLHDGAHHETSFGASTGIRGTYDINSQLTVHSDFEATFAGTQSGRYDGKSAMGKFHTFALSAGLTIHLGKTKWGSTAHRTKGVLNMSPIGYYNNLSAEQKKHATTETILAEERLTPQGMVLVNRGHLKMGAMNNDSLWGVKTPVRDISVDDFLMDKTEVTNRQYKAFIKDVCDSIVARRMSDPYYGGDRQKAIESLYIINPITGERMLDARQLIYRYDIYDYTTANMRKYRLDPKERVLNTDVQNADEKVIISKDTAYIDNNGDIIQETIERPLSGPYDFLNTYIVNIYPDTTCWINDFPNANNDIYTSYYFSNTAYEDYPVVGVTWEQANAYCAWRTEKTKLKGRDKFLCRFRLPTEAEWEYAARGNEHSQFPWQQALTGENKQQFFANFMPAEGNLAKDGNIITAKVGTFIPNDNGLYDMAGNVAEWTADAYSATGIEAMNIINPQLHYNAAKEDPYRMKRKSIRGGSWKDAESHIQSAWRTYEYQNQPRSYIGFRCVQSIATTPSEKTVIVVGKKKKQ